MTIRRARTEDLPGIGRLLEQVLTVHHEGRPDLFKPHARKYDDAELVQIIADDTRPIFVAVADDARPGEIEGYAFCVHQQHLGHNVMTDVRTLYVDDICVDEGARGHGVGRALYEQVVAYAREQGFYNVTLNVWSCNPGAQAFYEAMGMRPYRVGMEVVL